MLYFKYYNIDKQKKVDQAKENARKFLEEEKQDLKRGMILKTTDQLPPEIDPIQIPVIQEKTEIFIPDNYNDLKSLVKQLIDDGQIKPIKLNSNKAVLLKHLKDELGIE